MAYQITYPPTNAGAQGKIVSPTTSCTTPMKATIIAPLAANA